MERKASVVDPGSHPHPQTGTSASQEYHTDAQQLLGKIRRIKSDRDEEVVRFTNTATGYLPERKFATLEQFQDGVFRVIIERLKQHGFDLPRQKLKQFRWCLPTSLDQEPEWRLLLEDPLSVPPPMLESMIKLTPSTADDAEPAKNTNVFYIRTFMLQVRDLRRVLQGLLHDGRDGNSRIFAWLERIDEESDNSYFTLRYLGMSKNRPWDRHSSDAYSTSLQSFIGQFYRQVGMDCPTVLTNAKVHIVEHATADIQLGADILNRREQILIALFGDGVLNTEVGGKDIITLTDADHALFSSLNTNALKTNTVDLMLNKTLQCSATTRQHIAAYAKSVRDYVKTNATTRQGYKKVHAFSSKVQTMIEEQGTPRQLSDDSAVMISLGSDIGDTHEEDEQPFFEAGGRSADALTLIYNHFAHWEGKSLAGPFNHKQTKQLAKARALPFADVFPWPVKHKDDFPEASRLTGIYMNIINPMIVLTYGAIPTYAAKQSFKSFTSNEHERDKKAEQRKYGEGHWVRDVLGVPCLASFNAGSGTTTGKEFVHIPICHPGLVGHVGVLKTLLTRLLVMTSALAWRAMTVAVHLDQTAPSLTRKSKCEKILAELQGHLSDSTEFGRAFAQAKEKYMIATTVWHEHKWARSNDIPIGKPPRGILPAKTSRVRKTQIDRESLTTDAIGDMFEVQIDEASYEGSPADNKRYRLTWDEEDGQQWSIAPVILPKNVTPIDSTDKRFVCYTPGGIDIRDHTGSSLGDRKPLPKGATKLETIPIGSLVLTLSEQANAELFLSHWENIAGLSVNEVLVASLPVECSAVPSASSNTVSNPYYPKDFFDQSRSKRALPFTAAALRKRDYAFYLSKAKTHLPANPGDLLWLLDRFFTTNFPNGGHVDLISASLHANSVFKLIAIFCADALYKHHPHLRTLLAFASMAEMGQDERNVSANALTIACEVLRNSTEKKSKTANFGNQKSASRYVITLAGDAQRPRQTIRSVKEPHLDQDVQLISDVTDDEADPDEDFPGPAGGGDTAMSDDDDDMLLDPSALPAPEKRKKGKGKEVVKEDDGHGRMLEESKKRRYGGSDDDDDQAKGPSAKAPRRTSKLVRRNAV